MPRLLALFSDPVIDGRRMHEHYGWTDPAAQLLTDLENLNSVIPSAQRYTAEVREIPTPALTRATYGATHIDQADGSPPERVSVGVWKQEWDRHGFNPGAWPTGGDIHVKQFLADHNLVARVNAGEVDEVWLGGLPIPAAFEGAMFAPEGDAGAYHCHDRLFFVPALRRRFVLHMAQVSNWNLLHCVWHRLEATLSRVWGHSTLGYAEQTYAPRHMNDVRTYWALFTMTENEHPGEAQIGSCHFMPNSKLGYVSDMADVVPSGAHLWKQYPHGFPLDLGREDRFQMVSVKTWHGRPDYLWQFEHFPRADGVFDGRWANWWRYLDPNESLGRGQPASMPWVGTPQLVTNVVTRYGNQALIRWQARPSDPPDAIYRLRVDGAPAGSLQRRGDAHTRLSWAVPLGHSYRIDADYPGGWNSTWDQGVPTPPDPEPPTPPPPEPPPEGGAMLTVQQVWSEIEAIHQQLLDGCPKPLPRDDGPNIRLDWPDVQGQWGFPVALALAKSWPVETFRSWYPAAYPAEARARCVTVEPEPPVEPGPLPPPPTPTVGLRQLFDVQIAALEAQLAVWREYRERL